MDFTDLLLQAEKNNKEAAKQSQQVKRINTHFSTPAKKEDRSSSKKPISETLQKLIDEKEKEKQRRKEIERKERRKREKARQEQEQEEKRKNTFRIPKKVATDDPPSDAESFSSISTDGEADSQGVKTSDSRKSGGVHNTGEKHKKDKHSGGEKSEHSSSHSSKNSSGEHSSRNHDRHHHSKSDKSGHSSKDNDRHHHSKSDKSGHNSKDKQKHSSEKEKSNSSQIHKASSEKERSHSSSGKDRPHGSGKEHSHNSSNKHPGNSSSSSKDHHTSSKDHHHSSSSKSHKHKHKDSASTSVHNDSSGYVTSPSLPSESDSDDASPVQKEKLLAGEVLPSNHHRMDAEQQDDNSDMPVVLTRHHLKPNIERQGGSLEERNKTLAKLQAIRERMMASEDTGPSRKRAAKGEVKRRRAKREKLDGDFSGSCMEKINYDDEEKPSLKRPEPKPEEPKQEKHVKEKLTKRRDKDRPQKIHDKRSSGHHKMKLESKSHSKVNRFDAMEEKPKKKPRPVPRPPPVNFADLLKMAEQKQAVPVMVEIKPKKEKERRPMTQDEIDRKHAREERLKTKDYKDWYKYGEGGNKPQEKNEASSRSEEPEEGGFMKRPNMGPPSGSGSSQSKPFSIPRKSDTSSSARSESASSSSSRPSASQENASRHAPAMKAPQSKAQSHPVTGNKPQPHPTRPGMIANKPRAMAQHMNNQQKALAADRPRDELRPKAGASSRESSSQPRPHTPAKPSEDKTRGGNAWDSLFHRPEYKRHKDRPVPQNKIVSDSEEEEEDDDYEDDMDDFIDDEGDGDMDVSGTIRQLFGYDRRKFRDEDDDDRNMEVGFSQLMKEEARSARIGRQEDLEDIRREEEELRQKALKKKKR